jgi:LuxR family maltose regulon positive regulatory protein
LVRKKLKKECTDSVLSEPVEVLEQSNKLSIKLLGSFQLQYEGNTITLQRKSSLRLLFYLAVYYNQKIPKDILLEELFAEGKYASQNNRFYVSLSTLRKALEPNLPAARLSKYIVQNGELFFLDKNLCNIDLEDFQLLIAAQDGLSAEDRLRNLKRAVSLYQGDLLAEFPYESFLEPIREETKKSFVRILKELANSFWKQNDFNQALDYYDQALRHDAYDESVYWEYLERLLQKGNNHQAKQIGSKMVEIIEGELGVPVKERLRTLFSRW